MDASTLSPSIDTNSAHAGGVYSCTRCGYALFANEDKVGVTVVKGKFIFSYYQILSNKNILFSKPLSKNVLQEEENYTYGLPRRRISCAKVYSSTRFSMLTYFSVSYTLDMFTMI